MEMAKWWFSQTGKKRRETIASAKQWYGKTITKLALYKLEGVIG